MLIAQITDTHIVSRDIKKFCEERIEGNTRLRRVVAALRALSPQPDVLLLTGDIIVV